MQHGNRIGQSRGFDEHAVESADAAVVTVTQQLFERIHEIAAHGAAQAARRQHHHVAFDLLDEEMVQADLSEFVDQDNGSGEAGIAQKPIEQSRLARAQKSCENRQRDRRGALFLLGGVCQCAAALASVLSVGLGGL